MKITSLLICFLLVVLAAQAQNKSLTMNDAVVQQWQSLYPQHLGNLQWRAGSDKVSYRGAGWQTLSTVNIGEESPSKLLEAKDVAKHFGLKLPYLPNLHWIDENNFYFSNSGAYYSYNVVDKKGEKLLSYPKKVSNEDFHLKSKSVAYTIDNNLYLASPDSPEGIAITKNESDQIVSGQAIARHEFGIGKGTFWSPNGNFLAFYEKDESNVADYPLLDITTTPGTLKSIKYPMAGQKSEHGRVGIYNKKTKKTYYLDTKGPKDQYHTNVGWGPKEAFLYVAVVNRDQNHMWLNKYDATTGKLVKTLFEEKHEKYVEPENAVWFIPGKDNEFLWMSERDGFAHLYRYNTEGTLLNQVTKGNWLVQSILGLDASKKNVVVQGTDESGLNTCAYMADLAKGKVKQIKIKTEGIHSFKLSKSGKYLIDTYSNLETPNISQVVGLKGKVVNELVQAKNPLSQYKIGTTEFVKIKSADGKTNLHGRLIKPKDFDASKKYPVIVYVYGGPHAQMVTNSWLGNARLWMHYAAEEMGYIVFTLDNRGSANRGFDFENVIHRNVGDAEIADQLKGVEYLKSLPYVDSDRMAVHGWSFGGFMTTSLMLREPGTFQVGVAGGPVTDWAYYEVMYGERYMDRPEENREGYEKSNLMNHAGKLEGDLLLIHGGMDGTVLMQHSFSLVNAFVKEGKLIDFFPYPTHEHNVRGKDRVHLMNKVLGYIDEKLSK